MQNNQVLIGLGSNLNDPTRQLSLAIDTLKEQQGICLLACSSLYSSTPQGPQDQDNFVNAVVWIETNLSPLALLQTTQSIEQALGRIKTRHWGERVIDLDILFFNQEQIQLQDPDLSIPHPFALERDFVLLPALEIAPAWQLPDQTFLQDYMLQCTDHELQKI